MIGCTGIPISQSFTCLVLKNVFWSRMSWSNGLSGFHFLMSFLSIMVSTKWSGLRICGILATSFMFWTMVLLWTFHTNRTMNALRRDDCRSSFAMQYRFNFFLKSSSMLPIYRSFLKTMRKQPDRSRQLLCLNKSEWFARVLRVEIQLNQYRFWVFYDLFEWITHYLFWFLFPWIGIKLQNV